MYRGEFFDYDPVTGLLETYEEQDGKVMIHTYQDLAPAMDMAQKVRNEGLADEEWKEKGWTLYATIPPIVYAEMLKRGINVFDQNDIGRVVHEMNTTYSNFKTTYKHHEVK